MKKILLTLAVAACAASVFAQGTVNFNNRNTVGGFFAPVYGVGGAAKTGNSAAGLPAGTQTYAGALLTGSGFMAQLWSANGSNQAEAALAASVDSITTFRTGTSSGGFNGVLATLANVPKDAGVATLQVRAWDTLGGTLNTWAAAQTAWNNGQGAIGKSALFNLSAIGGDLNTPPLPDTMQSFNIVSPVPEPATLALAGLGVAGLLIFRRRK